jgi:large subunit ribosomal protein L25
MITLEAALRDVKVHPKRIRKEGSIPAVFYGPGQDSTPISVDRLPFQKAFRDAGESTVISLALKGGRTLDALIHSVDSDPVTGEPIHIDFYVVAKGQAVEVDVPIEFTGVAPAEKVGGVVVKVMHELRVKAMPAALPNHITVDLSTLEGLESQISVEDLPLPEGVVALDAGDEVIAMISAQKADEEVSVAPVDLSAIEVEKKGKKEEEGEESAS